jgi:hypothetical protein
MLTPLTLDNAIEIAPAIGATRAGDNTTDTYQFISTRNILEHVLDNGWSIVGASASGRTLGAQHRVTLVRNEDLDVEADPNSEGVLRMELFNSHNKTKRFMMAIGYFKWACSNGLIAAYGPVESIRTKHRFSDNRLDVIMGQIQESTQHFPQILNMIESFKQRVMTEEEQLEYAKYTIKSRYLYRKQLPKSFGDMDRMAGRLLTVRREVDEGNQLWRVYNRVQENIMRGIPDVTRPLRGHDDGIRVNRLMWKGAEAALTFNRQRLSNEYEALLLKNKKQSPPTAAQAA